MRLSVLFVSLVSSLLSSCAQLQVSDVPLMIRLPASKQCFSVTILTGKEMMYSPEDCQKIQERSIILTSEAWRLLKGDIQKNCQLTQCKQIEGAADGLFHTIDQALQKLN
jgi:hypothetical protein